MRLRKVKNAQQKLLENTQYYVVNPSIYRGRWQTLFQEDGPLHIEIGCGKGQFIKQMASRYPDINFVAVEKYDSVLLRCLEKVEQEAYPNLKLVLLDAKSLTDVFAEKEVSRIYINFSDPWPKYAHRKRRLTYQTFLEAYRTILKDDGAVFQKTDNRKFFEFSLESFSENGWYLSHLSLDLHSDNDIENVMTEFEEKWSKSGPIYRLEARKKKEF